MLAELQSEKKRAMFSSAHEQYKKVLEHLSSTDVQRLAHGDIEGYVEQEGTELLDDWCKDIWIYESWRKTRWQRF